MSLLKWLLVASLCVVPAIVDAQPQPAASAATLPRAWFFLSSDEIRAFRSVDPAPTLTLRWASHVDVVEGSEKPPADAGGTLILGPDYVLVQASGRPARLIDFALRREFAFDEQRASLRNDSLMADVDFYDMEAINRAAMVEMFKIVKQEPPPGHQQPLYEATLHVRAQNLAPLRLSPSNADGWTVLKFGKDELAAFRFGDVALTASQGDMLVKALRWMFPLHPAALDAVVPLRQLPSEIRTLHELNTESKARTSIRLEWVEAGSQPYPLPAGLKADVADNSTSKAVESFMNDATHRALDALAGRLPMPRPTFESYQADAAKADAAGDGLGTGLAWLAAALHFPDRMSACDTPGGPPYCVAYREQLDRALRDRRFRSVAEGAERCRRGDAERGARALASVDPSGQPHAYVVSMLLSCVLDKVPPSKAKSIDGLGTRYPLSPLENAAAALRGNPYLPSYYFDVGARFAMSYQTWPAWRLFDLGFAMGGGVKGDAFDTNWRQRERYLLSHYADLL